MSTAILLCNMGGPDSLQSVQPYLKQIFLDPDLIQIPLKGIFRSWFASFFAFRRAPESRYIFESLGGKSPLLKLTQDQAMALEERFQTTEQSIKVFPAMRYWHPFIEDVWQAVHEQGFETVIMVSMYPFYSKSTTGSMVNLIHKLAKEKPVSRLEIIDRFGDSQSFIDAMADQIKTATAEKNSKTAAINVLLSAHSLPKYQIDRGDPYENEINRTMNLLREKLPSTIKLHLSYQSKIGPIKWLGPSTSDKIKMLASTTNELWVYPLGFVADNSETLYEIGMLYKELADEIGLESYHRIDALNDHERFIDALEELIREKL